MRAETRLEAARRLGRIGDPAAVPALIQATEDVRPDVRAEAARALGRIGDPRAVQALTRLLDAERWEERRAAAEALGRIGHPSAVPILIEALSDSSQSVALVAATSLVDIGSASVEPMIALLEQPQVGDAPMRKAAFALGQLRDHRAVPALLEHLAEREDRSIRAAVADALGRIGAPEAIGPLVALLDEAARPAMRGGEQQQQRDVNEPLRTAARRALVRMGDQAAPRVLGLFDDQKPRPVRIEALRTLAEIDAPDRAEAFISALVHGDRDIRGWAEQFLDDDAERRRAILNPQHLAMLLRADSEAVRREAATRLQPVADEQVQDLLIGALSDEDVEIRIAVTYALGRIETDAATDALAILLDDGQEDVRFAAARALARRGDQRALVWLKDLIGRAHPDADDELGGADRDRVREAIAAIGRIGDADAVAVLEPVLRHSDRRLRIDAIEALGHIGTDSALDAVAGMLERGGGEVRLRAAHVLADHGDRRATPVMIERVRRGHPERVGNNNLSGDDRAAAQEGVDALVKLGDPAGFDAIRPLLKLYGWSDRGLRSAAIRALAQLDPERAVEPFLEELKRTEYQPESTVRTLAYEARRLKDPRIADRLIDWVQDPPPRPDIPLAAEIRQAAAASLVELGEVAVESLIERLTDPRVREGAIGLILARIGEPAFEPLIEALEDVDAQRRRHAAWALGQMEAAEAFDALARRVERDEDSGVRGAAVWALGQLRDPRALEPLIALLDADSGQLRAETVAALGRLGQGEAYPQLVAALEDKDAIVRRAAADALGMLGDPRAVNPLRRAMGDDDDRVAAAARTALSVLGARP